MYVDDGGQIPRQRLPNGPIDALEEVHFDVVWSRGAGMRRPADGNAHRIEPGLLYQAKIVGLQRIGCGNQYVSIRAGRPMPRIPQVIRLITEKIMEPNSYRCSISKNGTHLQLFLSKVIAKAPLIEYVMRCYV
jgi:hypothetical protein